MQFGHPEKYISTPTYLHTHSLRKDTYRLATPRTRIRARRQPSIYTILVEGVCARENAARACRLVLLEANVTLLTAISIVSFRESSRTTSLPDQRSSHAPFLWLGTP
jgi:hypothetical protein